MVGKLRAEIKQTKPIESLAEEVALNIQRTADVLIRKAVEMLKPAGISPTQYNALRILRGAGAEGLMCTEIADRMVTRDPDITRLLDRLETRGLVVRSREQKDRRIIIARITQEGQRLLSGLDKPVTELNERLLGPLGERKQNLLVELLEEAREKAEKV